jgi:hypothetical protein
MFAFSIIQIGQHSMKNVIVGLFIAFKRIKSASFALNKPTHVGLVDDLLVLLLIFLQEHDKNCIVCF